MQGRSEGACLAPGARSEIGAPCPVFFPENVKMEDPKQLFVILKSVNQKKKKKRKEKEK